MTAEEVLYLHYRIIEATGGSHGVRDIGGLQFAIQAPTGGFGDHAFYPSLYEKAAVVMRSIIQNHPFVDGNKRTGISAAALMLELNGFALDASQQEFEDYAVFVATDHPPIEAIADWLRAMCTPR